MRLRQSRRAAGPRAGFTLYDDPDRPRLMIKGRSPREGEWETFAAALVRAQRAILEAGEAGREVPLSAAMPTNLRDWAATIDFLKGAWDSGKETSEISCVDFYNAIETRDLFCRQGRAMAPSSPSWRRACPSGCRRR